MSSKDKYWDHGPFLSVFASWLPWGKQLCPTLCSPPWCSALQQGQVIIVSSLRVGLSFQQRKADSHSWELGLWLYLIMWFRKAFSIGFSGGIWKSLEKQASLEHCKQNLMGDSGTGAQKTRMVIGIWTVKVKVVLMRFQMEMRSVGNWSSGHLCYILAWNSLSTFCTCLETVGGWV